MSILKRKIFIAAMVVFSIIFGLAAIVNILQNKQTIAAAEEVANSSPDAGNVTAAEIITQIEVNYLNKGQAFLRSYGTKNKLIRKNLAVRMKLVGLSLNRLSLPLTKQSFIMKITIIRLIIIV